MILINHCCSQKKTGYKIIFVTLISILLINSLSIKYDGQFIYKDFKHQLPNGQIINNIKQSDIISPGHGYSSDQQQISPIKCYEVQVLPMKHASSVVHFDSGSSFSDIQKSLHVDIEAKTKVFMFQTDVQIDYLKSVQDTDYSFSINYYQYIETQVAMETGYGQAAVLTKNGYQAYEGGRNPNFGLICGDKFIDSYKAGATLVLGMKLQFKNHEQKEKFSFHAGGSFGSFGSISADIQKIAQQNHITGSVVIQGYQIGGNPSQLAKILNQKCGQNYCAASCSIQNMSDCQKAANGLIKYAVQDFTSQVSVEQNKGLSPFSIGFASMVDIKWLGLMIPPSWVDYGVQQSRIKLADAFFENKYYIQKFHVLLQKYPVAWFKNSSLFLNINNTARIVNNNMKILMDSQTGAVLCYSDPQNCIKNSQIILGKIHHLDSTSIQFLDKIKYKVPVDTMPTYAAMIHRNGDNCDSWGIQQIEQSPKIKLNKISNCFLDGFWNLIYDWQIILTNNDVIHVLTQSIKSTDGFHYNGCRHVTWPDKTQSNQCGDSTLAYSEYYFKIYQPSDHI